MQSLLSDCRMKQGIRGGVGGESADVLRFNIVALLPMRIVILDNDASATALGNDGKEANIRVGRSSLHDLIYRG